MRFVKIQFPNPVLGPGWYNSKYRIHSITFQNCNIVAIKKDAFVGDVFSDVSSLSLSSESPIQYEIGMFNGLDKLDSLKLYEVSFRSGCSRCLEPLKRKLYEFAYLSFPDDLHFNDLFGNARLSNLCTIHMVADNQTRSRTLAAANFSGLSVIYALSLPSCGIEIICADTFSYIGETLTNIDLAFNKIKTVNYIIFRTFFTTISRHIGAIFNDKRLNIFNNLFDCDCQYYELKSIVEAENYHIPEGGIYNKLTCNYNFMSFQSNCNNLHTIRSAKLCLNTTGNASNSFLKFVLRMVNGNLYLKTGAQGTFYLLIFCHDMQPRRGRCPSRAVKTGLIQCLLLTNATKQVSMEKYLQTSSITSFFITYFSRTHRFWPLHYITVSNVPDGSGFYQWITVMIIIVCSCLVYCLLIAGVSFLVYRNCRDGPSKEDDGNSNG